VQNPVDITGSATGADYEIGIRTLLDDPQVDIVMPWFCFTNAPVGPDIIRRLAELNALRKKPILVGATGGGRTRPRCQKPSKRRGCQSTGLCGIGWLRPGALPFFTH
jgi:3-hydroxypropionyl-CoA synthetase (ADP-forming)